MTTHQDAIVANYTRAHGITGAERTRIDNEARALMRRERRDITTAELDAIAGIAPDPVVVAEPEPETAAHRRTRRLHERRV